MNKENLNKIKQDIECINWEPLLSETDATKSFNILHSKIVESLNKQKIIIKNKRKDKHNSILVSLII